MADRTEEIKKFWDDRATQYGEDWRATLGEKYLRLLEIKTMSKLIKAYKPRNVLDVGCGNGYSTKIYATKFPDINFIGMDYSEKMIQEAHKRPVKNCKFFTGDVLDSNSIPEAKGKFDLIITQRCIQNLSDYNRQRIAINNLLAKKSPKGTLLLMECSKDGVAQLNRVRQKFGKEPIEGIEPWHNNFFIDNNLINDFKAHIVFFTSTYMFFGKVLHDRLSAIGYLLPQLGKFGYDRLYVIK